MLPLKDQLILSHASSGNIENTWKINKSTSASQSMMKYLMLQ